MDKDIFFHTPGIGTYLLLSLFAILAATVIISIVY
jgi:hypothetical protein